MGIFKLWKKHWLFLFLILIYIIYSFIVFSQFGITYDEFNVYTRADALYHHLLTNNVDPNISYSLIFQGSPQDVNVFYNNSYGLLLRIFNPTQNYAVYHLYNSLFGGLIFITAYWLFYKVTKKPVLAILAPIFIFLNVVFSGYLAINPKDMPFAVFYFLSLAAIYLLVGNRSFVYTMTLGILFGLTQSSRIVGFSLYPILLIYHFFLYWQNNEKDWRKKLKSFVTEELLSLFYVSLLAIFIMTITWPYLGSSFFKHFVKLFLVSKSFPWDGDLFFLNTHYTTETVPAYFIPMLFILKTPLFIIFFLVINLIYIKKLVANRLVVLFWLTLVINFFLYLVMKPVSFLRHYLYLFPVITSLAVFGFIEFMKAVRNKTVKTLVAFLMLVNILTVIWQMVEYFPYQTIYFNELVGGTKKAQSSFKTELWAQSNREAALWLADYTKKSRKINYVFVCDGSAFSASYYYPKWLVATKDLNLADYVICFTPSYKKSEKKYGQILHKIEKSGVEVNRIYRRNKP